MRLAASVALLHAPAPRPIISGAVPPTACPRLRIIYRTEVIQVGRAEKLP
jgi:hypothetical protein